MGKVFLARRVACAAVHQVPENNFSDFWTFPYGGSASIVQPQMSAMISDAKISDALVDKQSD